MVSMGKGDGVETCPVSGEKLTAKAISAEFFGRTVKFCCEGCLAQAKKNPERFIRKEAPAAKATAFLGKGDGVKTCPVTGEPVDPQAKGRSTDAPFSSAAPVASRPSVRTRQPTSNSINR
jgi:YHS domain-containing protein